MGSDWSSVKNEVEALYEMVDSPRFKDVVWSKSGRCIVIRNPEMFGFVTGPLFGLYGGMEELRKLLSNYGFIRIEKSKHLKYYNKFFRKGEKNLLGMIYRSWGMDGLEIPEKEVDSMNESCCAMMNEVNCMILKLKENEQRISELRNVLFSLCSYMGTLKPYHTLETMGYDPSNEMKFGPTMSRWADEHLRSNMVCSFGFLDEVGDFQAHKPWNRGEKGKRRHNRVKGVDVRFNAKRQKVDGTVDNLQQ
ncbi:putative heat shock transcription factor [Encephalitozoon cuniculi EcunIII-L]|uniref:Hsf1 domain containing protein n=1 Tax=Encephalitozoon cuniculi TaxID=6035 RepID=M1K8A3_ENCCN|nr:hsf1 domain containing protein [Encephalitozoon cuniculi]KMV66255.1 putative heat shock transcription factor [Encephalitozoon cuniculi EcunIII-L]